MKTVDITDTEELKFNISNGFDFLCNNLDEEKVKIFQSCDGDWNGNVEDLILY